MATSTSKCASAWLLSWVLDWCDVLAAATGLLRGNRGTSATKITTALSTPVLSIAAATGLRPGTGGAAFPAGGKAALVVGLRRGQTPSEILRGDPCPGGSACDRTGDSEDAASSPDLGEINPFGQPREKRGNLWTNPPPLAKLFAMSIGDEARALARERAEEIAALSWADLDAYGEREEEVKSPSGRSFRVKSIAFWDMEAWESDMYVIAKVYADHGARRWWPWKAVSFREGPGDPVPDKPNEAAKRG
jgi:hypothetical protein